VALSIRQSPQESSFPSAGISAREKQQWVTPKVVHQHYERMTKVPQAKAESAALSPMAKLQMENADLREENHKLKRDAGKGSLFDIEFDSPR
jgi:hypothetical protein